MDGRKCKAKLRKEKFAKNLDKNDGWETYISQEYKIPI